MEFLQLLEIDNDALVVFSKKEEKYIVIKNCFRKLWRLVTVNFNSNANWSYPADRKYILKLLG